MVYFTDKPRSWRHYLFANWEMADSGVHSVEEFPNFHIFFGEESHDSDEEMANLCDEYEENNRCLLSLGVENETPRRFATVNESGLDEIVDNAQAKKTKKSTKWAMSVFQG